MRSLWKPLSAKSASAGADMRCTAIPTPDVVLYHGTSRANAQRIVTHGFRRAAEPSYTGTAFNASEHITLAYTYGAYEERGAILRIRLAPAAHCGEPEPIRPGTMPRPEEYDRAFVDGKWDALRTYHGNVWLLWRPQAAWCIELLKAHEARRLLCEEIQTNGPDHGYNGVVESYAQAIHRTKDAGSPAWEIADCTRRLKAAGCSW